MATAAKSTAKSKTPTRAAPRRTRRTGRRDPLAISLLKQDHRQVETWFDEYEQLESDKERLALFNKIALGGIDIQRSQIMVAARCTKPRKWMALRS